mmetsp:Transcript_10798/g.30356  ORF Transcript_10798/g.30356 Transcript_10798/m.30356 type:complete len:386 (+) Transcript_10798:641-1798(+)
MVAKTSMIKRMGRRSSSSSGEDADKGTSSSYLFLSQTTAKTNANVKDEGPTSTSSKSKSKKAKDQQQKQTRSRKKKLAVGSAVAPKLTKNLAKNFNTTSLAGMFVGSKPSLLRIGGGPAAMRSRSTATTAVSSSSGDVDASFLTQSSGVDTSISLDYTEDDDARSFGTSGTGDVTTATGATAQVGNLTNTNVHGPSVLSAILDVSVDVSRDHDDDADDSCDDDFEDDPIIIGGSAVTIDYVCHPDMSGMPSRLPSPIPSFSSPKHDRQSKGRGTLVKSSIFPPRSGAGAGASAAAAEATRGRSAASSGPPSSPTIATDPSGRPIASSSFTPKVLGDVTNATRNRKRDVHRQQQHQQPKVGILERFLDRFSCGGGCDAYSYSIYDI